MAICGSSLICLSFLCFLIGGVMFLTRGAQTAAAHRAGLLAPGEGPTAREAIPLGLGSVQQSIEARAKRMHDATLAANASHAAMKPPPSKTDNPMRDKFLNARLGQTIVVQHPQRGQLTGQILGSIRYTELWQRTNSPSEPWVPTGNEYAAHWMGNWMLYEWQGRLYLFDEYDALSDQDIQAKFLPFAKQFAQSNQTAKVTFAYPPASWTMADIGKFTVAHAEGSGLRLNQGATGRFIHCTGADNRALVVEDYQSGSGGQDTAWIGWQIEWSDVVKIG